MSRNLIFVVIIGIAAIAAHAEPANTQQINNAQSSVTSISQIEGLSKNNQPVIVEFGATWCGWCHKLNDEVMPTVSRDLSGKYKFVIVELDQIDHQLALAIAAKYQIRPLPTLVLFRNGQVLSHFEGYNTADTIERWIQSSK